MELRQLRNRQCEREKMPAAAWRAIFLSNLTISQFAKFC
jgi:hypothetical protein